MMITTFTEMFNFFSFFFHSVGTLDLGRSHFPNDLLFTSQIWKEIHSNVFQISAIK